MAKGSQAAETKDKQKAGVQLPAVVGELEGRMSKDGNIVTFVTGEGEEVLNYGGLVAKDAAGRELESRISLSEGRVILNINVNGAQYPVIIDPGEFVMPSMCCIIE